MASVSCFEVDGMIRGFHVYKEVWEPVIGEELQCSLDDANLHDPFAVAVVKNGFTVGHLPKKISSSCSLFMRRQGAISCVVIGFRRYSSDLVQGGLEVPCKIIFRGPNDMIQKVERLVKFAMTYSAVATVSTEKSNEENDCEKVSVWIEDESSSGDVLQPLTEWVRFGVKVLSFKERDIIINGEELADIHMTFAQHILSAQFPNIVGLQATNYQFSRPLQTTKDDLIQIVHVNTNHWVVVTTHDCRPGELKLYDSMVSSIDLSVIKTLIPSTSVTLLADCPKQIGTKDCGVYAIAFCTSLAFNVDITQYNQSMMRNHLLQCFEQKKLTPFT